MHAVVRKTNKVSFLKAALQILYNIMKLLTCCWLFLPIQPPAVTDYSNNHIMWPRSTKYYVRSSTWVIYVTYRVKMATQPCYYWISIQKHEKSIVDYFEHTHTHTLPALVIVTYISCVTASVWPLCAVTVSAVRTPPSPVQSGSTDVHIHKLEKLIQSVPVNTGQSWAKSCGVP